MGRERKVRGLAALFASKAPTPWFNHRRKMIGTCRLCNQPKKLEDSHVIPAFVYKWLKESSATGHIRSGRAPNKRIQDGPTRKWFCRECEARLSVWETAFANCIFHPMNKDSAARCRYEAWFLKFCVSVSWRVWMLLSEEPLKNFSDEMLALAEVASSTWSDFLLDKIPHPGEFEQHFLPVDLIVDSQGLDIPENMNRYLMRSIDIDAVAGSRTSFIFSKLGGYLIFGFITRPRRDEWQGTRVAVRFGEIRATNYRVPAGLWNYLTEEAEHGGKIEAKISGAQKEKIEQAVMKYPDRVARSATARAVAADMRASSRRSTSRPTTRDPET